MSEVLTELQAAIAAGFTRVIHFQRARRTKMFPPPARELPGQGPVWTKQQIDAWFGIAPPSTATINPGEEEALRRARQAPIRRKTAVR